MAIETPQQAEDDLFSNNPLAKAPTFIFETEEVEIIALRLRQRGSCSEMIDDECCLGQGEAQRCLAICQ
jgi:hypothetical protein